MGFSMICLKKKELQKYINNKMMNVNTSKFVIVVIIWKLKNSVEKKFKYHVVKKNNWDYYTSSRLKQGENFCLLKIWKLIIDCTYADSVQFWNIQNWKRVNISKTRNLKNFDYNTLIYNW